MLEGVESHKNPLAETTTEEPGNTKLREECESPVATLLHSPP